ncbi:hypothetical protein BDW66DRAFT_160096 [Aspergillus desertorum]
MSCHAASDFGSLHDLHGSHKEDGVRKRSTNACQRCRKQKIKCSGFQPCNTCHKRKLTCIFDDRDQKTRFIEDLQRRIASLERGENDLARPDDGTSSNWSFARKILAMTHEHLYNSPLPTDSLLFEGTTYDLGWDGLRRTVYAEAPIVPTLDYSIYLINAVKFHAGQLYHLFDEGTFMGGLYVFYEDPQQQMATDSLWYIHYLVIVALGKALAIGQAMRIALAQGMHTDMPEQHLGEALVQRCHSQIHPQLPSFPGSLQKVVALSMQIRMCQIIAEINSTVYGADGRLNRKFLLRTKAALASMTDLAGDLQRSFDLQLDKPTRSGCIVLATRPLMLCFLKMRFHSADACLETLNSSTNVLRLLQTKSAELTRADSFLPFDLESTFVSSVVVLMAPAIDCTLLESRRPWLHKSYLILDDMISQENLIAQYRKPELEQMSALMCQLAPDRQSEGTSKGKELEFSSPLPPAYRVPELPGLDNGLTTAKIMAVAGSIDIGDVDWVAHAVTENQIW